MAPSFPTPKSITGGCLCNSVRYRVDFPADHRFETSSGSCQCTQCRKQTGCLFFADHNITPASTAFRFTSPTTSSTLKIYHASATGERAFCGACGSFIYWKPTNPKKDFMCLAVGTIDPLYLFGEGADGVEVPREGFGRALVGGGGKHLWVRNEIEGVTDRIELLKKGTRFVEGD